MSEEEETLNLYYETQHTSQYFISKGISRRKSSARTITCLRASRRPDNVAHFLQYVQMKLKDDNSPMSEKECSFLTDELCKIKEMTSSQEQLLITELERRLGRRKQVDSQRQTDSQMQCQANSRILTAHNSHVLASNKSSSNNSNVAQAGGNSTINKSKGAMSKISARFYTTPNRSADLFDTISSPPSFSNFNVNMLSNDHFVSPTSPDNVHPERPEDVQMDTATVTTHHSSDDEATLVIDDREHMTFENKMNGVRRRLKYVTDDNFDDVYPELLSTVNECIEECKAELLSKIEKEATSTQLTCATHPQKRKAINPFRCTKKDLLELENSSEEDPEFNYEQEVAKLHSYIENVYYPSMQDDHFQDDAEMEMPNWGDFN